MPVFRFKLTDTETGEFRVVSVAADSQEEALEIVQQQELRRVTFFLPPEEVATLEQSLKDGTLFGRDKARLFTHRQEQPYIVQNEIKE